MITKIWHGRSLVLCLALTLVAGSAQLVLPSARAQEPMGAMTLTVSGKVKVNGQPAATGDIVSSGSTVETAKGSRAGVGLGKRGHVLVLSETRMRLSHGLEIQISLYAGGSVSVSTGPGVAFTVKAME